MGNCLNSGNILYLKGDKNKSTPKKKVYKHPRKSTTSIEDRLHTRASMSLSLFDSFDKKSEDAVWR